MGAPTATYLVLKDFEEATGLVTQGGRLEDILFLFALVASRIKVWTGGVRAFFLDGFPCEQSEGVSTSIKVPVLLSPEVGGPVCVHVLGTTQIKVFAYC